jgi:hypothetical protein
MMLGPRYRYRLYNTHNQAVTVTVRETRFKRDSTGKRVFDAVDAPFSAVSVGGSTGTQVSTAFDNTAADEFWDGALLSISATPAFAITNVGALVVWLERSLDGGTTWPTAATATGGSATRLGARTITNAEGTSTIVFDLIAE